MTLHNRSAWLIRIVDIRVAGESVMPFLRAQALARGQLEDDQDELTVLPGEVLDLGSVDQVLWLENV